MPEVNIWVDLEENDLKFIEATARKEHRSRKAQVEKILEEYVLRNNRNSKGKE